MASKPKKVLVLRFSSIGDIVLTSPVLRSLKQQRPDWELHYFTKPAYLPLLQHNPHLDHIHLLEAPLGPQLKRLKQVGFDFILDLHHNLRTWRIKQALRVPSASFPKENWRKYWMVRRKQPEPGLPHIVQRYGRTLQKLGVELDAEGLEVFLPPALPTWADEQLNQHFASGHRSQILAVALGAQYQTKRWPPGHFTELLNRLNRPVLLLGGPDARADADQVLAQLRVPHWDAVAQQGLLESAALMKACSAVLTHDSGFMHIAAAFRMSVFSLWGSTIPEFGMTRYQTPHLILENKEVGCRPCSKIGFHDCPRGHFACMTQLTPTEVETQIRQFEQDTTKTDS
ncbi:MAG: glycosyltransferase family 9 protein [Bacteroidota bacterium]